MRSALDATARSLFEVPLLYRWKHWDSAAEYTLRNLMIHGLLCYIWERCVQNTDQETAYQDQEDNMPDEDSPDVAPAVKQRIRMNKVLRMLTHPHMVDACQCLLHVLLV